MAKFGSIAIRYALKWKKPRYAGLPILSLSIEQDIGRPFMDAHKSKNQNKNTNS